EYGTQTSRTTNRIATKMRTVISAHTMRLARKATNHGTRGRVSGRPVIPASTCLLDSFSLVGQRLSDPFQDLEVHASRRDAVADSAVAPAEHPRLDLRSRTAPWRGHHAGGPERLVVPH